MARLEDLIAQVEDAALRAALGHEVKTLKQRVPLGLVFERHLPENVVLPSSAGVQVGDQIRLREHGDRGELRVLRRDGDIVTYVDEAGEERQANIPELFVVKTFGESVYPTLTSVGSVERGEDRPYHAVINAENYHSLQVLLHCWEDAVDCIYIDPPYNTGARDWKYNNRYVDDNDSWRHSKWLSFMEKRLRLAKRLLRSDGVLICTIGEHEVHHLGVLLEQIFPETRAQLVTIVINPLGQARRQELGRVEEYAFFLFRGEAEPSPVLDDLLNAPTAAQGSAPRWERLLRGGTDSDRASRWRMFYPVFIDPEKRRIVEVGEPLPLEKARESVSPRKGLTTVWPVRRNGTEGRWRLQASTLRRYVEEGVAKVGTYDRRNDRWTLLYLGDAMRRRISEGDIVVTSRDPATGVVELAYANATSTVAKTVWNRGSHRAGEYGSRLLSDFLGDRRFPFPKSLYAVRDALGAVVGNRPNARIIDFFAGSGTTLHATALLNSEDNGRRQCILVTNNEVDEDRAKKLAADGYYPGDAEFEKFGIFEAVTRPRVEAALTGQRPDGKPVEGTYLDGRAYADGLDENCEFFRLEYLNPDEVELGRAFEAVHPLLWLIADARARRPRITPMTDWAFVPEAGYAVLFEALAVRDFIAKLNETSGIEHIFLVTDSEDAYAEMAEAVGPGYETHMLYRDYLRSFRIQAVATS